MLLYYYSHHTIKGSKQSLESRRKISKSRKIFFKNGGKAILPDNRGRHHSEETKKKMRLARRRFFARGGITWIKGQHHSEKTKKKISLKNKGQIPWNLGKKHRAETIIKISKAHKGKHVSPKTEFKKGHKINVGTHRSEETKDKLSLGKLGSLNPSWEGGKSFEPYSVNWKKRLRKGIRERDRYRCQICGITQKQSKKQWGYILCVHHIDYNKDNCDEDNLITLCESCHTKTNFNREYWIRYFRNMLSKYK